MEITQLQRLSFIKYLFTLGYNQSFQPEPINGASILFLHDSIELFLQLSVETLNISKNSQNFMDYWQLINSKLPNGELSQKESMSRLNKARVALKHHGILPSKLDIETFRNITNLFFIENCTKIFDLNFENISLIDAIKFKTSRNYLKQAESYFQNGNIEKTLQNLTLSFEYLLIDYEKSKTDRFNQSPFFIGEDMGDLSTFHLDIDSDDKLYDFVDKVRNSIEAMQKVIKILSYGIDYKKYVKYKYYMPILHFMANGSHRFHTNKELKLNKNEFYFCIDFIIESALKLQEFDYELN